MPERKVYIEEISQEVSLRRNTRIRRLSIKIGVDSGVVVCVPRGVSDTIALQFVIKQQNWIKRHLSSEKYQKQAIPDEIQLVTAKISFQEIEHNIPLIKKEKEDIIVKVPKNLVFEEKECLKREVLEQILRREAKDFLPERVQQLSDLHGFTYGKLSFRNQKTRWGSCSFHNNISLNIQLMRLPLHLIDYIIIHELCHTVHKNHSAKFWQLVHEKMGNSVHFCKREMQLQKIRL